ncbi:2-C-methyl-D-erythritol 4-phosphate cytidylyltransferase [Melghirimyces profundicolus]|uniref:2-C-methyl-D-erythritol 4-phosphate cytidylyltransferase n=1 Tax=Melghirimyces profundicolus TaxID=1242148 RepID=A0A2T6C0G1_9BACL|nr:IspD/TarI family cytidylyltransferase [Melghirimyces profundicolus]PTX61809.1 2-C-methyl-D-erythritol 4-phosphate cytidylyltransferase [Melghirimyces profundicolus]
MNVGIILAAGAGSRFGADKPKQFTLIDGKPVVYYTLKSFVDAGLLDKILVVLSTPYMELGEEILNRYFSHYSEEIHLCEGGTTRQESLFNGVKYAIDIFEKKDLKVVSHCAARPLLPKPVIQKNLELLEKGKSVDTVKRVYDTMLYTNDRGKTEFIDRDRLFTGLTPQSFYACNYMEAFRRVKDRLSEFTCACSLMLGAGYETVLYVTDSPIHKITVKEDVNIIKHHLGEWGA